MLYTSSSCPPPPPSPPSHTPPSQSRSAGQALFLGFQCEQGRISRAQRIDRPMARDRLSRDYVVWKMVERTRQRKSGRGREGGAERVYALGQWTHFAQPIGLLSPLPWHIISCSYRAERLHLEMRCSLRHLIFALVLRQTPSLTLANAAHSTQHTQCTSNFHFTFRRSAAFQKSRLCLCGEFFIA